MVSSSADAIRFLEHNIYDIICLDHDLTEEANRVSLHDKTTGMGIVYYLANNSKQHRAKEPCLL